MTGGRGIPDQQIDAPADELYDLGEGEIGIVEGGMAFQGNRTIALTHGRVFHCPMSDWIEREHFHE